MSMSAKLLRFVLSEGSVRILEKQVFLYDYYFLEWRHLLKDDHDPVYWTVILSQHGDRNTKLSTSCPIVYQMMKDTVHLVILSCGCNKSEHLRRPKDYPEGVYGAEIYFLRDPSPRYTVISELIWPLLQIILGEAIDLSKWGLFKPRIYGGKRTRSGVPSI